MDLTVAGMALSIVILGGNSYREFVDRRSLGCGHNSHRPCPVLHSEVSYDRAPLRGDANACVTIVEFSDFQFRHCRAVQTTLKQVLAKYPGEVKLAFRDFPVQQLHPQARLAAEAARCAGKQGRFWEYDDLLFSSQKFDCETLLGYATSLGMDRIKFEEYLRSWKFNAQASRIFRTGKSLESC